MARPTKPTKPTRPTALENRILALVLVAGLGVTVGPIVWGHFRRSALHESGVLMKATLVELSDTGDRHNSNPVVRIRLRVQLPDGGGTLAEVTMPMSPLGIANLKVGMVVPVRVDPSDPTNVTLAEH